MKLLPTPSKLMVLTLSLVICLSACKSSKKAAERARAEKERTEQEAKLKQQKQALEDEQKRKDAEEEARRLEASKQQDMKASTPYVRLGQYFDAVSSASSLGSANSSIDEALSLFATPDAPVLIIISGSGDQKDYDRPTNIKTYLNYLKDQKKNLNHIENLEYDAAGKITSVELRKN